MDHLCDRCCASRPSGGGGYPNELQRVNRAAAIGLRMHVEQKVFHNGSSSMAASPNTDSKAGTTLPWELLGCLTIGLAAHPASQCYGETHERCHRGLVQTPDPRRLRRRRCHGEARNAFTAAWVMQVSFDPLLLALSINPHHSSYRLLKEGRRSASMY